MDKVIAEFIKALRGADVRVSTAEAIDASRVVRQLGYQNRAQLKTALSLTLAKSQPEKIAFYACFDRFFQFEAHPDTTATSALQTASGSRGERNDPTSSAQPAPPHSTLDNPSLAQTELGQMLLRGDQAGIASAMANAAQTVDLTRIRVITQKGLFSRRMMMAMGLEALDRTLWQAEESPRADDQQLAAALRRARDSLRARVKDYVERQFVLQASAEGKVLREDTMMQLKLEHLRDYRDVQALVRKLAKKLIAMHSRRRRLYRRGQLDLRATLRQSAPYDGLPFQVQWKSRRVERPKLMVICDVSGSVSQVARFLLLFLYSLTELLPKVRAFAFSSQLGEVSETFAEQELTQAITTTLHQYGGGSTNYGRALADFQALTGNSIDHRTTVIMLGDARNNYGDARIDILQKIAQRAKQLIWLNPEDRNRWGSGDSEMLRYLPYCTLAEECNSLRHLERIIHRVLQRSR